MWLLRRASPCDFSAFLSCRGNELFIKLLNMLSWVFAASYYMHRVVSSENFYLASTAAAVAAFFFQISFALCVAGFFRLIAVTCYLKAQSRL
jgi:hypothetical protein